MHVRNKQILFDTLPISFIELINYSKHKNYVEEVKKILKKRYKKEQIIFSPNARTALYESFKLMDLKKKDEIIIPAYTSKPVLEAVRKICKPRFVDINSNNAMINIRGLSKTISDRTKAIVVTNTYGKSDNMSEIVRIAKENGISIIEDLAQAPWGEYNGKKLGTFGDYSILSFALCKDLTAITGGALLCNKENLNSKDGIYSHTEFINKCFWLYASKSVEHFQLNVPSMNTIISALFYKFLDLQRSKPCNNMKINRKISNYIAYILYIQMKNFDKRIKKRRENAKFYFNNLKPGFIPFDNNINNHTFFRFTIKVKNRNKLYREGRRRGINFLMMYDYYLDSLPNSLKASKQNLNIPVHHKLKKGDLIKIVDFINKSI